MYIDTLNRLGAGEDDEESKGRKIYYNADMYKICESVDKVESKTNWASIDFLFLNKMLS